MDLSLEGVVARLDPEAVVLRISVAVLGCEARPVVGRPLPGRRLVGDVVVHPERAAPTGRRAPRSGEAHLENAAVRLRPGLARYRRRRHPIGDLIDPDVPLDEGVGVTKGRQHGHGDAILVAGLVPLEGDHPTLLVVVTRARRQDDRHQQRQPSHEAHAPTARCHEILRTRRVSEQRMEGTGAAARRPLGVGSTPHWTGGMSIRVSTAASISARS